MEFKQDWDKAQERILAWWNRELVDRCVVQVAAPRDGAMGDQWDPFHMSRNLDNPEKIVDVWEDHCRKTFFGGEMIPNMWINLGPGSPTAFLGCKVRIGEDTVWFEPPGKLSIDDVLALEADTTGGWWKTTMEIAELAAERGRDKYFAGFCDLNSVFDILCHLRGTQDLLYDLIDQPDKVKQATDKVNRLWIKTYDELYKRITRYQRGSTNWMFVWFPEGGCDVQCDFCAMLSPAMFGEFVVPHLTQEIDHIGGSIYHLDGPDAIQHLEMLLDIPGLSGIQWVPGAGNPGTGSPKWFEMYRRIQEKGKLLLLQGMDPNDVQGVLEGISSKGVLIGTHCESEGEARSLLKNAEKWTRD